MRLLVTGADGFIGDAVVRAARDRPDVTVTAGSRRRRPGPQVRYVDIAGDLGPAVLAGIDVVVHCASVISGDEAVCTEINTRGTARVVAAAARAGVSRIVYLSTCAVFGNATSTADGADPPVAPTSPTSRSKAAAEQLVLAAGGVVVRPNWVFGPRDRWVRPRLAALAAALEYRPVCPTRLVSMVAVDDLARAIVALADGAGFAGTTWNVNHPVPVGTGRLLQWAAGRELDGAPIDLEQAAHRLDGRQAELDTLRRLARDHVFASSAVWSAVGHAPHELSTPYPS